MGDIYDLFFSGKELPTKKKQLIPNFFTKPVKTEENAPKNSDRDRSENLKYAEKLKADEENEMLTKILNRPADESLGIKEQHENSLVPDSAHIFESYEFDLPPVKLPICEKRKEIIYELARNDVIIIRAATGSGKSSQVPQYILEDAFRNKKNVNIIVTQPRRISAQSLAKRVALERKCELGSLVGYQIGLDRKFDNNDTRLLYCTTGVFLQKLINEKSLAKWSHIIIDEIHERDLDMDFVLLILRRLMTAKYTGTKLILMSATMETVHISDYFQINFSARSSFTPVILDLDIRRPHPVKVDYLDAFKEYEYFGVLKEHIDIQNPSIEQIMYQAGARIVDLLAKKDMKTFLIFLPGWFEIENFHRELLKVANYIPQHFKVIKLHSTMGMDDVNDLYNPAIGRKIILSTNIAESSITIPDIDFVIDFCLIKHLEADTSSNLTQLKLVWASKVNLRQREGRVGRTKHGQVIRMIFQEHYDKMPNEAPAEMQRTSLETVVLKAKKLKMGKPIDILGLALNPPRRCSIVDAILVLKELGALTRYTNYDFDYEDGDLTFAGEVMCNVPMDVRLSKLILLGYMFNVLKEMIIIAAGLSVRSIFKQNSFKSMESFEIKFKYGSGSSDVLAILNAYKEWSSIDDKLDRKNFELHNKLDSRNLRDMKAQIEDIMKRLELLGFSKESMLENRVDKYSERMFLIKICIAGAFYPNFYVFGGDTPDRDAFNTLVYKNPCHCVYYKNFENQRFGDMYRDQIIEHLYNNEIIRRREDAEIHFDTNSTRVIVEFKNLRNDEEVKVPGEVKFEIYKALRFARLHGKYKLDMYVLDINDEDRYLSKKGYKEYFDDGYSSIKGRYGEVRYGSRLNNKLKENCCIYPKAHDKVKGSITCIISPGKFYIQPEKGRYILKKHFSSILEAKNLQKMDDYQEECVGNGLVIVRNQKGEFYRAQIIETPYDHKPFKVRLIDYGNNVKCAAEDFYTGIGRTCRDRQELLREFFKYPPLCFEAKLAQCKPSVIYQTGYSHNATEKFKKIINQELDAGRDIVISVYAFNNYDKVASVYLKLQNDDSMNDILTQETFTQRADESYIYHISRTTDEIKIKSQNEHFDFKTYHDAPRGYKKLTLTGPLSTFSHNIFEKTTNCHENDVSIDPWSVNSILIDPYPFDGIRKVMVSACRSRNDKGRTTLRYTTVLPHVTGMASLLALIFCPTAELRYDKNFNRFTSILTGMGCTFDGRALYKEHDCLFHTDADFDDIDIKLINQLRLTMSDLMENFQNTSEINRDEMRNKATRKLFEIMQRDRPQVGVTLNDSFNWNSENVVKNNLEENMLMFPCHESLSLQPYSYERWNMLTKLNQDFEKKAQINARDESIRCVLCEETVDTLTELKIHVLKTKHKMLAINLQSKKPEKQPFGIKRHHTIDDDVSGPSGNMKVIKIEK